MKTIEIFITGIGAIATVFLACIAYQQLGESNKTQNFKFLYKFKNDFFNKKTTLLFQLVEAKYLKFIEDDDYFSCYFKVDKDAIDKSNLEATLKERLKSIDVFFTHDLDNDLLGHLEDLGIFLHNKIFSPQILNDEFGYYIETIWQDSEIKKYISLNRKNDSEFYERFESLYCSIKRLK